MPVRQALYHLVTPPAWLEFLSLIIDGLVQPCFPTTRDRCVIFGELCVLDSQGSKL